MTVDLFRASLDSPPVDPARLAALLSDEERRRIARLRFDQLRRRQEVATGLLRLVLGGFLDRDPRALRFHIGEHGKPALPDAPSFNLSHSGSTWLLGVAPEGRLGVDVEVHRPISDLESVARTTFHPSEAAEVVGRDGEARTRAFFRVWARKEAFIKAIGMGLSYPLDAFRVASDDRATGALLEIDDPHEGVEDWSLESVAWAPDLSAAIAWDRPGGGHRWRSVADPSA